jgi:hypothetical protein
MLDHGDIFEHDGYRFRVEITPDYDSGPPWMECDGHGPVRVVHSAYGRPDKAPGERILAGSSRDGFYIYDVAEAIRIAKRDGWGLGEDAERELAERLGRAPTRGEIVAEAVDRDAEYLRRWIEDAWRYVVVGVGMITGDDADGAEEHWRYLGGVEQDSSATDDYVADAARELAAECIFEHEAQQAAQRKAEAEARTAECERVLARLDKVAPGLGSRMRGLDEGAILDFASAHTCSLCGSHYLLDAEERA